MPTERIEILNRRIESHEGFLTLAHDTGKTYHEISQCLSIGRDSSCSLLLADPAISSRHCRIERRDQEFVLRDLRSRNGSFVNGTRVCEALLHEGDRIQLGRTLLTFQLQRREASSNTFNTSKNESWNLQLQRLDAIASSDLSVLILGPSGVGKEILAHQIHQKSSRRMAPFVSVNCSALGESLVESELFGHVKGSFTGATHDRKGAFESARGGTLFLDEIGDLPAALQPKLLRALENQEIRPVGSDRNVKTDVRIVTATHANLRQKVSGGEFRADLFYRIHGVQLSPPALKDRMEDFETLLYLFGKQYRVAFSFNAIQSLKSHTWPGNIRELKNLVARAKALFGGQEVTLDHLDELIDKREEVETPSSLPTMSGGPSTSLFKEIERRLILERLGLHQGNQRRVAEDLGMPRSTLNDRIKSYRIDLKTYKKGGESL